MCEQSTAYNTYATMSNTNPQFMGFSRSQNVNKEIIILQSSTLYDVSEKYATPRNFGSGVFFRTQCYLMHH